MAIDKIRTEHILSSDRTGDGDQLATANTGAKATGNLASWDASDDLQDSGVASSAIGKVSVAKAGTLIGTRGRINLIEGTNVTLSVVDDSGNDEVDVTVTAAGGGGGGVGRTLISTATASNSASVDFDSVFSSTYDIYEIELIGILPTSNNVRLLSQIRSGGSYQTSGYLSRINAVRNDGSSASNNSLTTVFAIAGVTSGAAHDLMNEATGAGSSCDGIVTIYNPSSTSRVSTMRSETTAVRSSATPVSFEYRAFGVWDTTAEITGIKFYMESGNIDVGTFRVWGVPTT